MASFVAFLRGINVSNRRVTSADLCAPFGSVGLDGATAFRASGNVVFDASREARGSSSRGSRRRSARRSGSRSTKPGAAATKTVLALATSEDRLAFDGRELYWLPSAGTQKSDLDWQAIEAALGVGTMRTIGTVEQIAAKFFG